MEVPPDREVGLNCAPSSTTGKDSNSRKTNQESLPPSPPPGLSPLHFRRFTNSFNSKISYVWSRARNDLHGVHGRNEGDEKKKKVDNDNSRCRVLQRHRGQFSPALIRCFYHADKNWQRGVHGWWALWKHVNWQWWWHGFRKFWQSLRKPRLTPF